MSEKIAVLVIAGALELRKSLRVPLEERGFLVCEACADADGLLTIEEGFVPQIVVADMDALGMKNFRAGVGKHAEGAVRIIALNEQQYPGGDMPVFRGVEGAYVRPFDYVLFENVIRGLARGHDSQAE